MRTSIIGIAFTALLLVVLVGCGNGNDTAAAPTGFAPDQTAEAYAYVHGGYVGQAVVTTNEEGDIDVTIDEAFLPHTLAAVDIESDQWNEDNTVTYVVRGETNHIAKWVSYNDTDFVGVTVGTSSLYVPAGDDGNPATDVNKNILEKTIIRNEDNMAAWFNGIQDGAFAVYSEFGGDAMTVTESPYGGLTKTDSSYWNFGPLGWQGNMDEIQAAAEEYGVGYTLDEMTRSDEGTWTLADATTGATASDFKDYFALVQQAAARLEMQ
jgi:hypothetical protein